MLDVPHVEERKLCAPRMASRNAIDLSEFVYIYCGSNYNFSSEIKIYLYNAMKLSTFLSCVLP